MNNNATEERLLAGCRAAKPKYQQQLYERYYGKMLSVCLRYAKDREEARDILQEGFIKVFASIQNFKGEGSLEGWVRRIMVNTAINHYHRHKRLQTDTLEDNYAELSEDNFHEAKVIQQLSYEELLGLIRGLPPAYQTVFNLYVIEGYNHKEIGEMLGINEGTSKSNLAKARMKLQKQLGYSLGNKIEEIYVGETHKDGGDVPPSG